MVVVLLAMALEVEAEIQNRLPERAFGAEKKGDELGTQETRSLH